MTDSISFYSSHSFAYIDPVGRYCVLRNLTAAQAAWLDAASSAAYLWCAKNLNRSTAGGAVAAVVAGIGRAVNPTAAAHDLLAKHRREWEGSVAVGDRTLRGSALYGLNLAGNGIIEKLIAHRTYTGCAGTELTTDELAKLCVGIMVAQRGVASIEREEEPSDAALTSTVPRNGPSHEVEKPEPAPRHGPMATMVVCIVTLDGGEFSGWTPARVAGYLERVIATAAHITAVQVIVGTDQHEVVAFQDGHGVQTLPWPWRNLTDDNDPGVAAEKVMPKVDPGPRESIARRDRRHRLTDPLTVDDLLDTLADRIADRIDAANPVAAGALFGLLGELKEQLAKTGVR